MGGGHIPSWVVKHVEALARQMPVVMEARIQSGYLLKSTYERPGSEIDLMRRGVTFAGRLPPLKARLPLTLLLRASAAGGEAARPVRWADGRVGQEWGSTCRARWAKR